MSNVLADFGNHVHSLKAKFSEARKELQTEEESQRPKVHHRHPGRLAYGSNQHQQLERCD